MKITLVTDHSGKLVGTIRGHELSAKKDGVEAGVMASPGHKLHQIEVDDSFGRITDAAELHQKLAQHVPAHH
jgi:hypothetical protein